MWRPCRLRLKGDKKRTNVAGPKTKWPEPLCEQLLLECNLQPIKTIKQSRDINLKTSRWLWPNYCQLSSMIYKAINCKATCISSHNNFLTTNEGSQCLITELIIIFHSLARFFLRSLETFQHCENEVDEWW